MAAYNSYFPATYQPVFPQQQQPIQYQQPQPQPVQNSGINWIQGEGAARSFLVAPNSSVVLFDSEDPVFFIKSADQAGMPTLRTFRYEEVTGQTVSTQQIDTSAYITREEFEQRIAELSAPKQRNNQQQRKENKTDA